MHDPIANCEAKPVRPMGVQLGPFGKLRVNSRRYRQDFFARIVRSG